MCRAPVAKNPKRTLFEAGGEIMTVLQERTRLQDAIERSAFKLDHSETKFDALLDRIRDCRYVLLGEATHGTHEFYQARAEITKRLIEQKGFTVIAWEADWPDTLRLNRFIRGQSNDRTALDALDGFKRFPIWMWRNTEILSLITWLKNWNAQLAPKRPKV